MWCTPRPEFRARTRAPCRTRRRRGARRRAPGLRSRRRASMSSSVVAASASARSTTGTMLVRCARDAISGTTPPNTRWMSCERITSERCMHVVTRTVEHRGGGLVARGLDAEHARHGETRFPREGRTATGATCASGRRTRCGRTSITLTSASLDVNTSEGMHGEHRVIDCDGTAHLRRCAVELESSRPRPETSACTGGRLASHRHRGVEREREAHIDPRLRRLLGSHDHPEHDREEERGELDGQMLGRSPTRSGA